ncbi:MAG: hypothetical protein ACRD0G_04025, partial [Acidimicrobiales bacterium]
CGRTDPTGAPLIDAGRITKRAFISPDGHVLTASAVAFSGHGTLYVSSVFNGVVAEYTAQGRYIRDVLAPPLGLPIGQLTGITPFGLAVAPDGTLFVADLGVVLAGPVDGEGSVVAVRFDAGGRPRPPVVVDENLTFPDGLGIVTLPGAP